MPCSAAVFVSSSCDARRYMSVATSCSPISACCRATSHAYVESGARLAARSAMLSVTPSTSASRPESEANVRVVW